MPPDLLIEALTPERHSGWHELRRRLRPNDNGTGNTGAQSVDRTDLVFFRRDLRA